MSHEKEKQLIGDKAVMLVETGMKIGLGTGSTAEPFIKSLKKRVERENLKIQCVCTSLKSKQLVGDAIPFLDESLSEPLDITFDGADLFDPSSFNSIKGGGGALLREKLVSLVSHKNVVLIDYSKISTPLQGHKVAIEIVPFGVNSTLNRFKKLGYKGSLRTIDSKPVHSDNSNYIFDIEYQGAIEDPISEHFKIKQINGVIETGFFFKYASIAFVGYSDGTVKKLEI